MNILKLKKMGMDFCEEIDSDLENYRLRLVNDLITKDGKRVCGDISRGNIMQYIKGKCKYIRNEYGRYYTKARKYYPFKVFKFKFSFFK